MRSATRRRPGGAAIDAAERGEFRLLRRGAHLAFVAVFVVSPVIHLVIVATDPELYRPFADHALFGWVTDAWRDVFMAHPRFWGSTVALAELVVAALLVARRALGYLAVVVFTCALTAFGWGYWLWSVPVLLIAVPALVDEARREAGRGTGIRRWSRREIGERR